MQRAWKMHLVMAAVVAGGLGWSAEVWPAFPAEQRLSSAPGREPALEVSLESSDSGGMQTQTSQKVARQEETVWTGSGVRTIRLWGDIGVHPTDRQAACQEAEQNAQQQLYEELSRWAEQLTGQKLSARRLVTEHAWLLAQFGVQQTQQMQVEEKSSGWVARQEITLSAPTPVLARWAQRLEGQKQQRVWWLSGASAATLLGWLIGLWGMARWDRATGGYYRGGVVLGSLLILATLTGLGWWLLWVRLY